MSLVPCVQYDNELDYEEYLRMKIKEASENSSDQVIVDDTDFVNKKIEDEANKIFQNNYEIENKCKKIEYDLDDDAIFNELINDREYSPLYQDQEIIIYVENKLDEFLKTDQYFDDFLYIYYRYRINPCKWFIK